MILKMLLSLVLSLLKFCFSWVSFPDMPTVVTDSIGMVMDCMESAMGFVWLIVPQKLVIAVIPVILVVENFDLIYSIMMWILKKIPFLGLK